MLRSVGVGFSSVMAFERAVRYPGMVISDPRLRSTVAERQLVDSIQVLP